jgi:YD repeat-containing protein
MATDIDYTNDQSQQVSDTPVQSMSSEYIDFLEQNFALPGDTGSSIESLGFPAANELLAGLDDSGIPPTGDKESYELVRSSPNGLIQGINYENGDKVEYKYDDTGKLMEVTDSSTGTTITRIGQDEWQINSPSNLGQPVTFKGDIQINQKTGAMTTTLSDGRQITVNPDGRSVERDADGNIRRVNDVRSSVDANGNPVYTNYSATANYDANGKLVSASDSEGNAYTLGADGQWYQTVTIGGVSTQQKVNGKVVIDEYGVRVSTKTLPDGPSRLLQ